jgi:hypothetical protein
MPTHDVTLLNDVGQALWGPSWKGPMAEAVRHQKNAVADWAAGRVPVPAGVWSELKELMRRRRHELDVLVPRVQKAHDVALARTVEQTKMRRR